MRVQGLGIARRTAPIRMLLTFKDTPITQSNDRWHSFPRGATRRLSTWLWHRLWSRRWLLLLSAVAWCLVGMAGSWYIGAFRTTPTSATTRIIWHEKNNCIIVAETISPCLRYRSVALRSYNTQGDLSARQRIPLLTWDRRLRDELVRWSGRSDFDPNPTKHQMLVGWPIPFAECTEHRDGTVSGGRAVVRRGLSLTWKEDPFRDGGSQVFVFMGMIPYRPILLGLVMSLAAWFSASLTTMVSFYCAWSALRYRRRLRRGRCPTCNYPLILREGSHRCPECGLRIDLPARFA